jgi:hypothetical protein
MTGAPRADDIARLEREGFQGFRTVARLRESHCLEVPVARGVYVVVREASERPEFLARSVGGRFRGQDPTVPVETLEAKWVDGAAVLYVGRARGPGVRSLLRQRVKRMIRFGQGRVVGHRGGRYVWQLRDHAALRFAWYATGEDDPARVEAALLERFALRHGALPFANLRGEASE